MEVVYEVRGFFGPWTKTDKAGYERMVRSCKDDMRNVRECEKDALIERNHARIVVKGGKEG